MNTAPHSALPTKEEQSSRIIPLVPDHMENQNQNPAADKKSFLIYKDTLHILKKMTPEQAGNLFLAIAHYQTTGELPELDLLTEIAITPFINQFKRDEAKYLETVERNRSNGKNGGRPRKESYSQNHNETQKENPLGFSGFSENPEGPKKNPNGTFKNPEKPDTDTDTDTDTDRDRDKEKEKTGAYAPDAHASVLQNAPNASLPPKRTPKPKPETKAFVPPTLEECRQFFQENGYTQQAADKAFYYYADANWKDSKGQKVLNWKQKMRGVWFKDEDKAPNASGTNTLQNDAKTERLKQKALAAIEDDKWRSNPAG